MRIRTAPSKLSSSWLPEVAPTLSITMKYVVEAARAMPRVVNV